MADFDFRSRVNIPTEAIANRPSGFASGLNSLTQNFFPAYQQAQQAAELLRKRRAQQEAAAAFASMPSVQNDPVLSKFAPMIQANPEFLTHDVLTAAIKAEGTLNKPSSPPKPQGSYWVNPNDLTDISPVAKEGYIEYKTTAADAGGKVTGAAQAKAKNAAMSGRVEAWNRSIDTRQINEVTKRVGLTPKMQSALQQNNTRAARAVEILSKPNITWQELVLGEIDLAGIMQGGVPHVDELKSTHFPGWSESWAEWKTKATQTPQETVPPAIKNKVLTLVKGVIDIDNRFLTANARFNKKTLLPTIRNGQALGLPIDEMTGSLTEGSTGGSPKQADPLGIL